MSRAAVHSADTWTRLRAYRYPYRGAAVALTAIDQTVGTMRSLRCGEVSGDGTEVNIDGHTRRMPDGAELFVCAQLLYRQQLGAGGDDLFFADERGPPTTGRSPTQCGPAVELGIPSSTSGGAAAGHPSRRAGSSAGASPSRSCRHDHQR